MLEIIAAISLLCSVVFFTKRKVIGWPIGLIGVGLYSIIFFQQQLYADFILQFIFIVQSLYGWWNWSNHKKDNDKLLVETDIETLSISSMLLYFSSILFIWLTSYFILSNYTDAALPMLDSIIATVSLIANWLMMKRKIESWYLWIIADILLIIMFLYTGLYVSSGLYVLFLINAIYGWWSWKKELK